MATLSSVSFCGVTLVPLHPHRTRSTIKVMQGHRWALALLKNGRIAINSLDLFKSHSTARCQDTWLARDLMKLGAISVETYEKFLATFRKQDEIRRRRRQAREFKDAAEAIDIPLTKRQRALIEKAISA
jgi:hypothetical protein